MRRVPAPKREGQSYLERPFQGALFPCVGLGDGLIALVLAHNFSQVGCRITTYHPLLWQMRELFPHLALQPRPDSLDCLDCVDRVFIIYERLDWMQRVIERARARNSEKTTILNPIATPRTDYPYWEQGRFDGSRPFAENLVRYLREVEGIDHPTIANGITMPKVERDSRRIVLHPTSSRAGKNWPRAKFLKLAKLLEREGYEPVFILTPEEAVDWPDEIEAPRFASLVDLARFVAGASLMIGNDSGIGHLASCLGVPTLTICRSQLAANFWRPAWAPGRVVAAPRWVPNLKGMRWRDTQWQHLIPVSKVMREFSELCPLRSKGLACQPC